MISLDHLLLQEEVLTARFACDLNACKGACCTLEGGAGAPLLDSEVRALRESVPKAMPYLNERSRSYLDTHDPVEGAPGSHSVACIDDKDCVFAFREGGIARCSIERAHAEGSSTFRKPISCHLFPIRVANFGGPYLHYDQFEECAPGRAHGAATDTLLVESVRNALVRAYGEETTTKIIDAANELRDGGTSA
jgi:hypothetical protein